jgi:hypothetical protein
MDKLVLYTLPNYINITLIILLVVIVTSFITFIFATITEKENLSMVTHATLIISLILSVVILVSACIISRIIVGEQSYTITKTDDTIRVNSHSDWVDNTTYNIIGHRDGRYYLNDEERQNTIIKLSDDEFAKIENQQ